RHGAVVLVHHQKLERPALAVRRGDDPVHAARHPGHLDELVLAKPLEELLDDAEVRPHVVRQLAEPELPEYVERLQREVLENAPPDPGLLDRPRRRHHHPTIARHRIIPPPLVSWTHHVAPRSRRESGPSRPSDRSPSA